MWPVDNLCTLDVTTVIYDTHDDRGKFLLCSMYWSKDFGDELPPEYQLAMDLARDKGYIFLSYTDSNAHSPLTVLCEDPIFAIFAAEGC